jgi:DNA-binding transcriptional regulator YiaG
MIGHTVSQMISRVTMETQNTHLDLNPKAIKTLRKALSLSQQELASVLGVGVATVSRWERGTVPSGTAALILHTLISEPSRMKETSVTSKSGYAIYRLLKDIFEREHPIFVNKEEK